MVAILKRLFGTPAGSSPKQSASMIETAYAVVDAYGEYCEHLDFGGQILSEGDLPFPKSVILNSLIIVAGIEKDPEFRSAILVCGSMLSNFQPDIGREAIWPTGLNAAKLATLVNTARDLDVDLEAKSLVEAVKPDVDMRAQYEALTPLVAAEADRIRGLLERSLAASRP